ncbi:hypothetical protein LO772_04575 [Yinghuangia sp. ASG 101]|uniref:hypothetical protein n=1 Tax=Yinghuangia sp. ASG 101 TaxID=2896848 RepID=UPI001E388D82|nr:hypothetical protein [Yinghuangia sp. ASG 101]UGQ12899.1 hypothetical protein LO772_04575 [Yinghuangia sp. ASG 101]
MLLKSSPARQNTSPAPVPPARDTTEAAPAPGWSRRTAVLVLGCVALAAYTGLRMPGRWAVTLQAVSLQDGFHRRFLVGTVLRPFAAPAGYPYELFVAVSFVVLGVLVAVLVRLAVVTRKPVQRLLIMAFLLLPTGGYLFHEIGYFDQIVYLGLFGAVWLLYRGRVAAASLVTASTVLVHEIALLTVLPLFLLAALRELPPRRALAAVAPTVGVGLVVLAVPAAGPGAPTHFERVLIGTGFPLRSDALDLFGRTQTDSYQYFDPWDIFVFLWPLAVLIAVGMLVFARIGRRPARLTGVSVAAAVAPILLAAGGWDRERWAFLLIANCCVALWFWLDDHGTHEITPAQVGVVLAVLLVASHVPLTYFDGFQPRALTGPALGDFWHDIATGGFFDTPRR